ncbi:aminopeptidase [Chungangia koreensis]|uniref:Aminopeptidase n=1 Tax=Chungangia koreensis TaxID=752657 RepID=A0ABV8X403_9LACT
MNFNEKLAQYAELAVQVGMNVQKGQPVLINTTTDAVEFARLVVAEAYKAGASRVTVNFTDEFVSRAFYENASEEEINHYPEWAAKQRDELIAKNGALLWIDSEDPDLLEGIPSSRISAQQKAGGKALENYRNAVMSDKIAWSIIAIPSEKWAKKVFPHLPEEEQVNALWETIFSTVRIGEGNAVEKWHTHIEELESRATMLNEKHYKKLHYKAPGTDLTIELAEKHIWLSGASKTPAGVPFIANMPTEEVYTAPLRSGVNGTVSNTKPLVYSGNVIDGFVLTFKDGKVVDVKAEKGEDLLKELLNTDEGSAYLGEVALVPHESPISSSNILFYNTLFDENASNHLALGGAYGTNVEGGRDLTESQLPSVGLNTSITHEDFMVGSAEMDIDGELADGTLEPIFRKGNWAF